MSTVQRSSAKLHIHFLFFMSSVRASRKFQHHQHSVFIFCSPPLHIRQYNISPPLLSIFKNTHLMLLNRRLSVRDTHARTHAHKHVKYKNQRKKERKKKHFGQLNLVSNLVPVTSSHRDHYDWCKIKPWIQGSRETRCSWEFRYHWGELNTTFMHCRRTVDIGLKQTKHIASSVYET